MNKSVAEPRCIRIFDTREEAERACDVLKKGGFECYVTEDKFGDLTLPEVKIPARFRLWVDYFVIGKVADYLKKEMGKS